MDLQLNKMHRGNDIGNLIPLWCMYNAITTSNNWEISQKRELNQDICYKVASFLQKREDAPMKLQ